ncbi:MAG TPA: AmmeMemoRadiSam system protein A [Geobacteraceae bacterium]|nr:AmmeMemoRadiSam system protein A [Geobacteraceae bacterium]
MNKCLSSAEKEKLISIARESIISFINERPVPDFDVKEEQLLAGQGCFVTIKREGKLRGCLGQFTSDRPLHQLVKDMAIAAATRDPRFYPMGCEDLESFEIEISVLSPLKKIESIEEIEVGKHGLYIEKNFYRGVLLPQVAVEHGWDRNTFLSQTCQKAGLDKNDWKEEADIYTFIAEVFAES